jgi:hypothetical protein
LSSNFTSLYLSLHIITRSISPLTPHFPTISQSSITASDYEATSVITSDVPSTAPTSVVSNAYSYPEQPAWVREELERIGKIQEAQAFAAAYATTVGPLTSLAGSPSSEEEIH